MKEIEPTEENLNDPYVLQLIETLSKNEDEIERLTEQVKRQSEYIMISNRLNNNLKKKLAELED